MKFKLILLYFFLIFNGVTSCGQVNRTYDNKEEIEHTKKLLEVFKAGNTDELKSLLHEGILKRISDDDIDEIMEEGHLLLNSAEWPKDSLIRQSNDIDSIQGKEIITAELSLPLTLKDSINKDSIVFLNVRVRKNKILAMHFYKDPFEANKTAPEYSEPHLDKHAINIKSIFITSIHHRYGFRKNEKEGRLDISTTLTGKPKPESILAELFELINNAQPDSTDFKYKRDNTIGKPEIIELGFRFNNPPYDKFGNFSIYYHLNDEPGKEEPMSKYIIVKHSEKTRYLYAAENNAAMVEILKKIAYNK